MPLPSKTAPTPEQIKTWRTAAHLSQLAAAAQVGVSQVTFCHWETGTHIPGPQSARLLFRWRDRLVKRGVIPRGS